MANPEHDAGTIQVLLDRFNSQRLPRALELKDKVDAGNKLEQFELEYLGHVFEDIKSIKGLLDRHPEYELLVSKTLHLYNEITKKALENEQ